MRPPILVRGGSSLLGEITFPIGEKIVATLKLDYRTRRGIALGFDSEIHYGKQNNDVAKITSYYLQDQNPDLNRTSLPRNGTPTSRYRFSIQDRTHITDTLEATVEMTKLSDIFLLQDFFPAEFRVNPQPDNLVALTQTNPLYTLTAYSRFQLNTFIETTERLPEIALDIKRQNLFGSPIFYEGETSAGHLGLDFAAGSIYQDYSAYRVDSFHQLTYPNTYFGWLSLVPRVGFRETYYSETQKLSPTLFPDPPDPLAPEFPLPAPETGVPNPTTGAVFRSIFNAGLEGSFKLSREWNQVQSRALGLDGLRHIIQPFFNFSWVSSPNIDPATILQFDRVQASTQLNPIDFPQFTSIDSIDNWTVARVGVRNRLQTRRDDLTVSWLELETYVDVNFRQSIRPHALFQRLQSADIYAGPVGVASGQLADPAFDKGFTEVNTSINFSRSRIQLSFGHRYLNYNPFFHNSSLFAFGGYYRINDNWGVSVLEQYESPPRSSNSSAIRSTAT